jgi:hypothetical protein
VGTRGGVEQVKQLRFIERAGACCGGGTGHGRHGDTAISDSGGVECRATGILGCETDEQYAVRSGAYGMGPGD